MLHASRLCKPASGHASSTNRLCFLFIFALFPFQEFAFYQVTLKEVTYPSGESDSNCLSFLGRPNWPPTAEVFYVVALTSRCLQPTRLTTLRWLTRGSWLIGRKTCARRANMVK